MRKILTAALVIALATMLVLPAAAPAGPAKGSQGRGPAVRGKLIVEGIVTAVNPTASAFTLQITKPGHQMRAGGSTLVVLVQQATLVKVKGPGDDDENVARRSASIADVHVGDRVQVEGFRLDDGRVVALRLDIKNRAVAGPGIQPPNAAATGVVTAKGASSLVIAGTDGGNRVILITPSTDFRGQRASFAAIQPGDMVVVQGTVNADGSIVARQIETTFSAGTTISGVVTAKSTVGPMFLILNNSLAVNVSADTRIVSGGQSRSFADLQVGQTVTVMGTPISVGGVTVGINARVIMF